MLASGSCPPASVGILHLPPPFPPDPPDPSLPSPLLRSVPLPSSSPPSTVLPIPSDLRVLGVPNLSPSPSCSSGVSAAELLASYLVSPKSFPQNPNLVSVPVVPARGPTFVNPSSPSQCSLLDSIPGSSPAPPPHTSSAPYSSPSTDSVPQTWADKAKLSTDKSLKRMSTTSTSLSPEGIPRVSIPDEVFQRGALLHKDFIVGRFFGRVPSFKTIQNVLNYLWGKGNRLEIHLIQATRSMLVRIPSDFIREKVLKKRIWYVDTAMFHVAQWSDGDVADTSLLESIQIWAHLKGVPFDLMTNEGLSWITDAIGFPKEMDDWTKNLQSLSVAHVKVEVDATKPLPSVLELVRKSGATFRVDVEYPWLPPTCSHCKQLGHIIKDCLKITRKWVPIQREKDPEKNANSSLPVLATVFEPASVNPTPPTDVPSSTLAATVMPISSIPPPPKPLLLPPLTQPPPSSPPSSPVVAVSSQFPPPSYSFRTFHAKKPDWESPKRKYKLSSKPPLISPENQIDYSNPFAPLSNLSLSNPQLPPPLPSLPIPPSATDLPTEEKISPVVGSLLSKGVPSTSL
ncbi:hypothetical protein BRARA_K01480 [Brassica rapa]|uniref:DUF4283 domain-containing protein n=1 Tax=Brassica campestris TaxID=3711 RepID=A0A397KVQ7_BRACM|nr:hypothetical protein BRARA_K01480 [Brassica rapa]